MLIPFTAGCVSSDFPVVCDSADFDGTNDYMKRGSAFTGASASKEGLISVWLRMDGGNGTNRRWFSDATSLGSGNRFLSCRFLTSGVIDITGLNSGLSTILNMQSNTAYGSGATWRHVLCSWDLANGLGHLYVNDADDLKVSPTLTDDSIPFNVSADMIVGADGAGNSKFNGCYAEFFFHTTYLDITVESNRRKFITSGLKPVSLGSDGSHPLGGTQPLLYLHLDDGEAVANFATNAGSGGNFTITGSLDTGSDSPSD